jgi:hypothetical protein
MVWAKVAFAGGLFLLFAAFAFGTEDQRSTSQMEQSYDCGNSISASWLEPGTPDQTLNPGPGATADERRAADACRAVIHRSRVMILTTMGVGGLLALVGLTAIRERRDPKPGQLTPVRP